MFKCITCYDRGWLEEPIEGIEAPEGLAFVRRCGACELHPTDIAAAEARSQEMGTAILAVVCRQPEYMNYYRCPDDRARWTMIWSCMCDDRCPTCDHEIEPYQSSWRRQMNPLAGVDIIFKDEGPFWTVGAETAGGIAFLKEAGVLSSSQPRPEADDDAGQNTVSTSVRRARGLMRKARAARLSVFEF